MRHLFMYIAREDVARYMQNQKVEAKVEANVHFVVPVMVTIHPDFYIHTSSHKKDVFVI